MKKKALPLWIREGLEKLEKNKQKKQTDEGEQNKSKLNLSSSASSISGYDHGNVNSPVHSPKSNQSDEVSLCLCFAYPLFSKHFILPNHGVCNREQTTTPGSVWVLLRHTEYIEHIIEGLRDGAYSLSSSSNVWPFADVTTKAALSPQVFKDPESWSLQGFEPATSFTDSKWLKCFATVFCLSWLLPC